MKTQEQIKPGEIKAGLNILFAISDAIKEAGAIPSGHLYAAVCGKIDASGYERIIQILKNSGVVREQGHVLIWSEEYTAKA